MISPMAPRPTNQTTVSTWTNLTVTFRPTHQVMIRPTKAQRKRKSAKRRSVQKEHKRSTAKSFLLLSDLEKRATTVETTGASRALPPRGTRRCQPTPSSPTSTRITSARGRCLPCHLRLKVVILCLVLFFNLLSIELSKPSCSSDFAFFFWLIYVQRT